MKVDRLISIIMILQDKKRISAEELAEMFEVSPRTIYRDIDAIDLAGIPVRAISGVGGGFEIMPNYKIDKNVFSSSDLSAILMGLSSVSNMMKGNELINALAKVKSFIPADRAKDIEVKANQVHIDLSPWQGNRNTQTYLEIIKIAIQECRLLTFEYTDQRGNKTTRLVEPYQLVLKNSHWYWYGYCLSKEDYRLFKLTRTSSLKMLEDTFIARDFKKPELDFTDMFAAMEKNIKIRIHKSVMDRVLDYCAYEQFNADGNDYFIVDFPFIENDFYYNMLFSFGDKCECLEPPHVRAEIKKKISEIAAIYES